MSALALLFSDYTFQIVMLGTSILGIVSGALGSFAVLRKQSLLGDAMSHAALPGIAIAFLLTLSKSPWILLFGAAASGWVGTILMIIIVENTTLKRDAALGIILSVFFGFGLVLLTIIQKLPIASQAGLNSFLFGSAATLLKTDIVTMSIIGILTLTVLALFWKEFKCLSFDPNFLRVIGYPYFKLDILLTTLIVFAIVIGLQTVGVVLMSAMVIAPAAAARQWTDRLSVMVILASFFGALSGCIGVYLSSTITNLPTGPTVVLVISSITLISLCFAPNRGLFWAWLRHYKHRKNIHADTMLSNMLLFTESITDPYHPHELSALKAVGKATILQTMTDLETKGFVIHTPDDKWALTEKGYARAKSVNARLDAPLENDL